MSKLLVTFWVFDSPKTSQRGAADAGYEPITWKGDPRRLRQA